MRATRGVDFGELLEMNGSLEVGDIDHFYQTTRARQESLGVSAAHLIGEMLEAYDDDAALWDAAISAVQGGVLPRLKRPRMPTKGDGYDR